MVRPPALAPPAPWRGACRGAGLVGAVVSRSLRPSHRHADLVARCAAYVHWGVEQPGHYRTLVGGRMPADLVPLSAHGAGAELLESIIVSLAAVTEPAGTQAQTTAERRWQAGLMLWTAMHGLISLYSNHGSIPWTTCSPTCSACTPADPRAKSQPCWHACPAGPSRHECQT
ncbi:MAG TPA: TetR-like C-terminal domain-containing protein [Actinospica sp.]|nr:TetR-like C-terminal domain-containing protein [Actinospica sp.]